jgi:hypothetical protein
MLILIHTLRVEIAFKKSVEISSGNDCGIYAPEGFSKKIKKVPKFNKAKIELNKKFITACKPFPR